MYTILTSGVIKTSDGKYIPVDTGNTDYQEYLAWVAEGNTAEIEEVSIPVPSRLPHFKFRVGLAQSGLLEQAESTIAALPVTDSLRLAWDARADVLLTSNLLSGAIAAGLITQEQFDAVWSIASQVP